LLEKVAAGMGTKPKTKNQMNPKLTQVKKGQTWNITGTHMISKPKCPQNSG